MANSTPNRAVTIHNKQIYDGNGNMLFHSPDPLVAINGRKLLVGLRNRGIIKRNTEILAIYLTDFMFDPGMLDIDAYLCDLVAQDWNETLSFCNDKKVADGFSQIIYTVQVFGNYVARCKAAQNETIREVVCCWFEYMNDFAVYLSKIYFLRKKAYLLAWSDDNHEFTYPDNADANRFISVVCELMGKISHVIALVEDKKLAELEKHLKTLTFNDCTMAYVFEEYSREVQAKKDEETGADC